MKALGIVGFILALLLSVMIHEFGHYITARKFGMRVSEFFVGFGKRIWSYQRGETEFGIKAIPAGGYCRIDGMSKTDVMEPGQEGRAFYRATSWRKLIVLGAGSFLHFLLGFLLFVVLFGAVGTTQMTPIIDEVSDPSPAKSAGLLSGDEIVAFNGARISNWRQDVQRINATQGKSLAITIKRSGSEMTLDVSPKKIFHNGESRWIIGITNKSTLVRASFLKTFGDSYKVTKELIGSSAKAIVSLPAKLPALWGQTFEGEKRDASGLVGIVGVARVSGEITSTSELTLGQRLGTFILIVASLNIFIGVFNLLPILPLDGGHMAVAIADEVRALYARLRRRVRPAAIDVNVLTPITAVVFVLLVLLTVLVLIADIFNPVSIHL